MENLSPGMRTCVVALIDGFPSGRIRTAEIIEARPSDLVVQFDGQDTWERIERDQVHLERHRLEHPSVAFERHVARVRMIAAMLITAPDTAPAIDAIAPGLVAAAREILDLQEAVSA